MTKSQVNRFIKQIDKHMAKIAKDRDALDEFISELQGLEESCTEALDNLQAAKESLSQFV